MKRINQFLAAHAYGLKTAIFILAALTAGFASVWFMWTFEFVLKHRLDAAAIGNWRWITTPLIFLGAVEIIRRFAPSAAGSGIPQVILAAKRLAKERYAAYSGLISVKTMTVKIVTLLLGLWACASTGREGPTVQIAACIFFFIAYRLHMAMKLPFDMRAAVVAGGAAGLAAAFNTPLAGVTFAIEELSIDCFGAVKDVALIAIVMAGIAAKTLTGEYVYFGRSTGNIAPNLAAIVLVGLIGGGAGALFSTAVLKGRSGMMRWNGMKKGVSTVLFSLMILGIAFYSPMRDVCGPGNVQAQSFVHGHYEGAAGFFIAKFATTLLTYWSGIAGGIFAPSLSMGSAIGAWLGPVTHASAASCALIGMAAFLSGTIQAPITSFVIIFEMTEDHQMLLPVMLCSLIGVMTARIFRARHLYQALAEDFVTEPLKDGVKP